MRLRNVDTLHIREESRSCKLQICDAQVSGGIGTRLPASSVRQNTGGSHAHRQADQDTDGPTRDTSMDGHFFYGVLSTRIVCRPSCAARPARPESVVCYETVEQASLAGFRPCLRCRPDLPETW